MNDRVARNDRDTPVGQMVAEPDEGDVTRPDGSEAAHSTHRAERAPRSAAAVGWGVAFVAAGAAWSLALLDVPIPWELVLPAGIIIIGIALLAGSPGAVRGGLIGLGTVLAVVALVGLLVPALAFTVGDREITVAEIADLETAYEHGAGDLVLDLHQLELTEDATVTARMNFGELVVIVPPNVSITGEAAVGAGEVTTFDGTTAGFAPSRQIDVTAEPGGPVLDLDLDVGFGRIEVRR